MSKKNLLFLRTCQETAHNLLGWNLVMEPKAQVQGVWKNVFLFWLSVCSPNCTGTVTELKGEKRYQDKPSFCHRSN
jgi:hypothetical protein